MKQYKAITAITLLMLCACTNLVTAQENGKVTENIRIESDELEYALQYRVYVPNDIPSDTRLPTLYVTDGQWYLSQGRFAEVIDREITEGNIAPIVVVFVDNRDPDNLSNNRRNSQFFCNGTYADFYQNELVKTIERDFPVSRNREDRVIMGVSFGGLNAACFGLMAHETFGGIAMQSPATHPIRDLFDRYKSSDKLPVRIFFSIGSKNDNTAAGRRFKSVLKNKGYEMLYKEVPHGHNWRNWKPLLDDVVKFHFPAAGEE